MIKNKFVPLCANKQTIHNNGKRNKKGKWNRHLSTIYHQSTTTSLARINTGTSKDWW